MAGISSQQGNPTLMNKKLFIGQNLDDDLGLNWYQFRFRNHDSQIGRFVQIDPLADSFAYNSPFAYAENKLGMGFDLEGLELFGFNWGAFALENSSTVNRPIVEGVVKTTVETGGKTSSKGFSSETLQNFKRGSSAEADQLAKNGLQKNNSPIEVVDPKTGKTGTTIPDAFKNDGNSTVEIKNVKSQGLTKQLRLQEKFSNDNGLKPELIINEGAKLSTPLKNSTFDIRTYSIPPAATDATGHGPLSNPSILKPVPKPVPPEIQQLRNTIF